MNVYFKTNKARLLYLTLILFYYFARLAQGELEKLTHLKKTCLSSATFCTLLLDRDKKIGCSQCEEDSIAKTVRQFKNKAELESFASSNEKDKRAIFLSRSLFTEKGVLGILKDAQEKIASVVVAEDEGRPESFSPDLRVPNSEYTAAGVAELEYNRFGDGSAYEHYPFNIFQVNSADGKRVLDQISKFGDDGSYPQYRVESRGTAWSCDKKNSGDCLKDGSCHPVGGRSAWSALNGLDESIMKVLAITAPMDSSAFFHDRAFGVKAEISSLAVLMAVVEALGEYARSGERVSSNIAFFAFNTEAWGFSGSSRFLKDVKEFECETAATEPRETLTVGRACEFPPMNSTKFKAFENMTFTVLSIDSLGSLTSDTSVYIHGENVTTGLGKILRKRLDTERSVSSLPLTAANSFKNLSAENTETFGIADYGGEFKNPYFHSQFDNDTQLSNRTIEAMNAVVEKLTLGIMEYVYDENDSPKATFSKSTARDFVDCFGGKGEWADCKIAQDYLGPSYFKETRRLRAPTNYPGIYTPELVRNSTRYTSESTKEDLVKAFMAYHTRIKLDEEDRAGIEDYDADCTEEKDCDKLRDSLLDQEKLANVHVHCVKSKCIIADAYLHNAYGPGIQVTKDDDKTFKVSDPTVAEAAWTETFWDEIEVCTFTEDSTKLGVLVFLAGILVLVVSLLLTVYVNFLLLGEPKVSEGNAQNGVLTGPETPVGATGEPEALSNSTAQNTRE